ncbi:MAG TPA: hypothetical protein DCX37_04110 [Firmicutes bacterium]|jgi:energy-coupling factor transporter ATP-binding protein EcfA2|nr:hypothetical protein [Bacillota bacterium]HBG45139.1 hypothetical protein [Bacillota bacterium]HBL68156.1 hypothetical protein [Bacillota bacterium]HBR24572.1 hypothetical protein [Bacillota bacterium]HCM18728.1 hypothetical protein [Bacillota bacterium]
MKPLIQLQSMFFCIGRRAGMQQVEAGAGAGAEAEACAEAEAVLADINLSINSGEAIACLGKNGSGKTTLLKLMAGLLEPTAGKILFKGDQAVSDSDLLGDRISWISSGIDKYFIGATVQEDLEFGLLQNGLAASEVSRKVNQVLEQYQLEDFRYLQPLALDAATKRRLAFASAIITGPDLLLIDEMLSGLDEAESAYFGRKIKELTSAGCTVVRVTQQISEIMDYQRAIVLAGKTIVADGKPADVFCDPSRVAEWGLHIPVALTISSELCREELLRQPTFTADALVRAIGGECGSGSVSAPGNAQTGRARAVARGNAHANVVIRPGTAVLLTGRNAATLAESAGNLDAIVSFEGFAGMQKRPVVAFLPGNPEELFIESTVWKEVTFGLQMTGGAAKGAAGGAVAWPAEALQLCGLDPVRYSGRDPRTLSLGEQRRVAMAAVLALSPECICLERPLEGLDAEGWESLVKIIEMLKARGTAVLIISADVDYIWKYCDAIYLLDSGQLLGSAGGSDPDRIAALLVSAQFGAAFEVAPDVACDLPEELRLWQCLRQMGIIGEGVGSANGVGKMGMRGLFLQTMLNALIVFLRSGQNHRKAGEGSSDCGKAGTES